MKMRSDSSLPEPDSRGSGTMADPGPARDRVLSRRQFLPVAAAGLAMAGLPGHVRAAMPKPRVKTVIVGAHPWVYAARQPDHDITPILPSIFADLRFAGMQGIELMHTALRPADAVERIGELSDHYRLPVIGSSFGGALWDRAQHGAVLEDAELVITRLAKLGGRTLGTSVGQAPQRKTEDQLDAQAEVLRRMIALGQRHRVEVNLHNHTYEVADNMHDLKGTLSRIPRIKLGPDLNWLVRAGVDPIAFLRHYRKQIKFLHLRDQKADGKWSEALGEGTMNYKGIGQTLHDIDFQGYAVIELAHEPDFKRTRPIRQSFLLSREFVRQTLRY